MGHSSQEGDSSSIRIVCTHLSTKLHGIMPEDNIPNTHRSTIYNFYGHFCNICVEAISLSLGTLPRPKKETGEKPAVLCLVVVMRSPQSELGYCLEAVGDIS
jgi:hypothetical protein